MLLMLKFLPLCLLYTWANFQVDYTITEMTMLILMILFKFQVVILNEKVGPTSRQAALDASWEKVVLTLALKHGYRSDPERMWKSL